MFRISCTKLVQARSVRSMATVPAVQKASSAAEKLRMFLQSESTRKALKAAAVELRPPTPAEIPRAISDAIKLFKNSNWRQVTVRDAWRNTLVTTEVLCWFFVGECLGKGTLIGYQV